MERSRSVEDVLRNSKEDFSDLAAVATCGLRNLRVECRKKKANTFVKKQFNGRTSHVARGVLKKSALTKGVA
jgi:hypothetical protein